jgi:hypothetical protein
VAFVQKFFTSFGKYADGETRTGELNRLWYDSVTNTMRIGDGTPGGKIVSGAGLGSSVHEGDTPPSSPKAGDMWWNSTDGRLYIYFDNNWVDASPDVGQDLSNYATKTYVTNAINGIVDDDSTYVTETFVNTAITAVQDRLKSLNNLHTVVLDNTGVTTFGGDAVPSNPSYSLGTLEKPWKDVVVTDGSLIMKDSNPGVDPLYWANHLGYATLSRGGLKVRDNTNTFEIFQLDPTGRLLLKSTQPINTTTAAFDLVGNTTGTVIDPYNLGVMIHSTGVQDKPNRTYADGIGTGAYAAFIGRRARGTADVPTAVQADDIIVRFGGNAYGDTIGLQSVSNVRIDMIATENQTDTARGTAMKFYTTLNGTTVTEPTAVLDYNGLDFSFATSGDVGITFRDSTRLTTFPGQAGQDGKYLKVVGTTMTWADIPAPAGAVIFKGTWNANTNSPAIADSTGTQGWEWIVGTAGTQDLGNGNITFAVGDLVIHDGTHYQLVQATGTAQVNADWNAISGVSQILHKPTLATVATSGSYTDLINKPTIPAAQINVDWNATSGVAQILNKPTIPGAQVQSDWTQANNTYPDYIKNKPTIPAAQIQSDWNQTDNGSLDFIKNKPSIPSAYTLPTATTSVLGGVKVDGTTITISGGVITAAAAVPYTLPQATTSVLGGIKIGTGLSIDGSGVVSTSQVQTIRNAGAVNTLTIDFNTDEIVTVQPTGTLNITLSNYKIGKVVRVYVVLNSAQTVNLGVNGRINTNVGGTSIPSSGVKNAPQTMFVNYTCLSNLAQDCFAQVVQ